MKAWIENLKHNDEVLVHSANFDKVLIKTVNKFTKTKAGRGFGGEKQLLLNDCHTRFDMRGRGMGIAANQNKWITEATPEQLEKIRKFA